MGISGGSFIYLRRENHKLQRQVARLEALVQRRTEQLRILEDLATELQREMAKLRASQDVAPAAAPIAATPARGMTSRWGRNSGIAQSSPSPRRG